MKRPGEESGAAPGEDQERVEAGESDGAAERFKEERQGPTDEELIQALRNALRRVEGR